MNLDKGKVYKIINDVDDEVYIGSTTKRLSQRFGNHTQDAINRPTGKIHQKMRDLGNEHFAIELIELYPCETVKELRAREDYWIKQLKPALNVHGAVLNIEKRREYMTQYAQLPKEKTRKKEFYNANIDSMREKSLQYYRNHQESCAANHKEWLFENMEKYCCAACDYNTADKSKYTRHCGCKRHKKAIGVE
jgi:group I intron endonuclease